jgi:hypothetical protein
VKYFGVGKPTAERKVEQYLARWPQGLTSARMAAWIDSCTKDGGYSWKEFETAKKTLRDSGVIAHANGIWYLRGPAPKEREDNE